MKRDEDLSPGSISGWDVNPALTALRIPGEHRKHQVFPVLETGWVEEGKRTFFNSSPVFLHALWGTWMLKLPTALGPECHLSNPQPPLSVRKGVIPTPLKLQAATLCLSLENTLALNASREALNKKLQLPLLPPSLFAPCTPKAFVSTLLHMYWSYFWPRVTWLCLHNWVPTSWSVALIVCKIIAGKCLIPEKCLQSSVCLYLKSKIKKNKRKQALLQHHS